ncbi:putative Ig domain-containing protein [Plesiomonas shigelloides]|uniref:putative Ig domain-containing protein n=1 Tax=Plesiomonas shigelloides TaxID=703 RepID=UPI001E3BF365|nr:putative Ig domain-containing protein [Plesiomonas shigelloides]
MAGSVTKTVTANSSNNAITLNLSGGTATSVAVATNASHGTATASGTSITYTPTAGYSGADSFTYTATNAAGTSTAATVSITVTAPTLSLTPSTLSAGTVAAAYSATFSASSGTAPYSYAVTLGALPDGLTLNTSTGELSGTPTADGTSNFTITATDANSTTGARAYSLVIGVQPVTANAVTTTVAANSSANTITLNLTGGTAISVAVATNASHGTATASGTGITYTPTAGYSGADSFTYTATNAAGTSTAATVSITVTAPTLSLTPSTLFAGTVAAAYSATISTSSGTAPYSYAVTLGSLPDGLTLNTSTGELSGTPTADGTSNFTITATDANSATGARAYSLVIGVQPVTANAVTTTVAANSSANTITLNLTGGTAISVAVATNASHGTATASGTGITYTPTAGYSGADSFTYTATNAAGTSTAATVSITVTAPTLSLTPSTLSAGTVAAAYSATISASSGTAPYSYAVTLGSLPDGLTLNTSTGELSGTPTADGTSNFTITATDANSATGARAYSLVIGVQPVTANAVTTTVAANSSANTITLNLSGGTATSVAVATNASHGTATASGTSITYTPTAGYSGSDSFTYTATNAAGTSTAATVSITVTAPQFVFTPLSGALPPTTVNQNYQTSIKVSGGTPPYSYAISNGALPDGLALNPATGEISGIPKANGDFNFSVTATDANQATTTATYSLVSNAEPVIVVPSSQVVEVGATGEADLTAGASGGPFSSARLVSISPENAGTASIEQVEDTPAPVALRSRALPRAATAPRYVMHFTPAPAFTGTAVVMFVLNSTNGASGQGAISFIVNPRPDPSKDPDVIGILNAQAQAAVRFAKNQISNFTRRLEFLHSKNNCGSLIEDLQISKSGQTLPLKEATQALTSGVDGCKDSTVGIWSGGFINFGSDKPENSRDTDFTTTGLSIGADYKFSDSLIAGFGIGYGSDKSTIGNHDSRSDGEAFNTAIYASFNPAPQIFIDGIIGYSKLQFDSRRYNSIEPSQNLIYGSRDGDQWFGSLTNSYELRYDSLTLSPYGRFSFSRSNLDAFQENGNSVYNLRYDKQTHNTSTLYLGLKTQYDVPTEFGYIQPNLRVEWGHNLNNQGQARIGYKDIGTSPYLLDMDSQKDNFVNLELGAGISVESWMLNIGYKTTFGQADSDQSVYLDIQTKF